jgi:DNA repair exonuclease SbcCD ATPase subunit
MPLIQATLQELNEQEATIRAQLKQLETQLTREMEQKPDLDPVKSYTTLLSMKNIFRQILPLNKELERIKDAQIQCLQAWSEILW